MPSRRHVLALLAAAPFAAQCAPANLPDPIAAWRDPGAGEADPRRFALAHAILAPNPHNRQPWLVDLVGENEIVLHADLGRLLPATDPFDRQIVMGCGAFLELLDLAARSQGRRVEINLWPEGEPQPRLDARPVAHVKLAAAANARDPLFDAILARRTNREPFETRAVEMAALNDIAAAALRRGGPDSIVIGSVSGDRMRDELRQLAWDAFEREFQTPAAHQETVNLIRVGREEIATHRDGIAIRGPMVEFARAVGLVNKRTLADIENKQTRDGLEAWRPLALDAPAFMWIDTTGNTRATQIEAGRAYARLNLAATAAGLSMHPWSQALQEYPEMAALYARAEEIMATPEFGRVQMLARVGYGPAVEPAPRRGLAEHLRA
jgi:hypothetical protein